MEKLREIAQASDALSVQKEFNQLVSQFKSFASSTNHRPSHTGLEDAHDDEAHDEHEIDMPEHSDAHSDGDSAEQFQEVHSLPDASDSVSEQGLDQAFNELVASFREKLEAAREAKRKLEAETVATARDLLTEMQRLIITEENIGKAFTTFNAIQEKWKSLPKVSNEAYRELYVEYSKALEQFFYNIKIYRALQELDLKHNLEEKKLVLEDQKKLLHVTDIQLLEVEVRLNQDRWNEIGPTFHEEWDKLKNEFWEVTKTIYKRIQDFYQVRRQELEENLLKKQELVEKATQFSTATFKSQKKWMEKADELKALQNEWKLIGPMPREKGKAVQKAFRDACDTFFDNKKAYFDDLRKVQRANQHQKEQLLSEAISLKESTDWKNAAARLKQLQKQWREVGAAHPKDENRLWKQFREACDHFFAARNTHMGGENERQAANLEAKKKIVEDVKAVDTTGNRDTAFEALKALSKTWREVGHVPMAAREAITKAFQDAMDAKYGELKVDKQTRSKMRLADKVESLKDNHAGERLIRKEHDLLRNKISRLQAEIALYENNMGFFAKSKGADKLKQEVMKKIDRAKEELDGLFEQLEVFRNA